MRIDTGRLATRFAPLTAAVAARPCRSRPRVRDESVARAGRGPADKLLRTGFLNTAAGATSPR